MQDGVTTQTRFLGSIEESSQLNDYLSLTTAFPSNNAANHCQCCCHNVPEGFQMSVSNASESVVLQMQSFSVTSDGNSTKRRRSLHKQRPRRYQRRRPRCSDLNNHNRLKIDWANLDKKEFMKLVSSLDVVDLFSEVVCDSVKFSDGSKKWQMLEYVLQRKDRRIFVGGQGFVLFVRRRQHSSSLAMKVCLHNACRTRMERYQLKANLQIAAQRESRFISDLLVYYMTSKFFISVMYKAKHSSLKVIKREIGKFPPRFVKYYASCVISAIFRLHRIGICHKDIKADNVLIDHRGVPQLADFGLAVECKADLDEYLPNRRVTTMQYYPPECLVLGGKTNEFKTDAWLFGFFLTEIYLPSSTHMWSKFQGSTGEGWRFKLCEACHLGPSRDDALGKLLRSLLRQDPSGRPSIREAMRFSYFSDVSWRQLEAELPAEDLHVRSLLTDKGDVE